MEGDGGVEDGLGKKDTRLRGAWIELVLGRFLLCGYKIEVLQLYWGFVPSHNTQDTRYRSP